MKNIKYVVFMFLLAFQVSYSQNANDVGSQIQQLENPAQFNSNIDGIDKAILQQVVNLNQFTSSNFDGNSASVLQFGLQTIQLTSIKMEKVINLYLFRLGMTIHTTFNKWK